MAVADRVGEAVGPVVVRPPACRRPCRPHSTDRPCRARACRRDVTDSVSPSTSVSFASTAMITAVSSLVVAASSTATGASFDVGHRHA